jgi:predicted DNA-binding transcriptional regulator AlpA
MKTHETSLMVTAHQAASLLGISAPTWWRRDAAGLCPRAVRHGRTTRWRRDELLQWIEAGCPPRAKWEQVKAARKAAG